MEITFFDTNRDLIDTYRNILDNYTKIKLNFIVLSIDELLQKYKFDAIISPANSYGLMNGGIDYFYKKLDKDIEKKTQKEIMLYGITNNDRPFLPVGRNLLVNFNHPNCQYMICMPTMSVPSNICGTRNVYNSFSSVLQNYDKIKLACPGLGTGVGGLSPVESAKQILEALNAIFSDL